MLDKNNQMSSTHLAYNWNNASGESGHTTGRAWDNVTIPVRHLPNPTPQDETTSFPRVTDQIVIPVICLLGFLGNLINILVLGLLQLAKRKNLRGDHGVLFGLTTLAVSDLMFCAALFPRRFVTTERVLFTEWNFVLVYQLYGTGVITTLILTSTWLTVVMACMRFMGICHPFLQRRLDNPVLTKLAYLLVFPICFLLNLPSFWSFTASEIQLKGETNYLVDIGYFDEKKVQGKLFIWFKSTLGIFAPVIILIYCNCSLVKALRESYLMRRRHVQQRLRQQNQGGRITVTLVAIITLFVVLVVPCELMDFFLFLLKAQRGRTEVFLIARSVANTLQVINFAFNFLLYCVTNAQFRATILALVFCRSPAPPQNNFSSCSASQANFTFGQRSLRTSTTTQLAYMSGSSVHGPNTVNNRIIKRTGSGTSVKLNKLLDTDAGTVHEIHIAM